MMKLNLSGQYWVVAIVAVMFHSLAYAASEEVGKTVSVIGKVLVKHQDENKAHPVVVPDPVFMFDKITSALGSHAKFMLKDDSILKVGPSSNLELTEVVVGRESQQTTIKQLKGRLRILLGKKLKPNSHFEVHTPVAVAGVRGTDFEVWVDEDGRTAVRCFEGEVAVSNILKNIFGEVVLIPNHYTIVEENSPPIEPLPIAANQSLADVLGEQKKSKSDSEQQDGESGDSEGSQAGGESQDGQDSQSESELDSSGGIQQSQSNDGSQTSKALSVTSTQSDQKEPGDQAVISGASSVQSATIGATSSQTATTSDTVTIEPVTTQSVTTEPVTSGSVTTETLTTDPVSSVTESTLKEVRSIDGVVDSTSVLLDQAEIRTVSQRDYSPTSSAGQEVLSRFEIPLPKAQTTSSEDSIGGDGDSTSSNTLVEDIQQVDTEDIVQDIVEETVQAAVDAVIEDAVLGGAAAETTVLEPIFEDQSVVFGIEFPAP